MAMATDKKLYIALGVLAVLGGAVFFQQRAEKREQATYTIEGHNAKLPDIKVSEADLKKIDKLTIDQPPGDAGKAESIVLTKQGEDDWKVTEPVDYKANASNVKSALDNLKTLEVKERISPSKDSYGRYELADDKALHVVAYKGKDKAVDLYLGQSGSRGQMARIGGRDGVYALGGFSRYLFARELKNWRDRAIFKFPEDKVTTVEVRNENVTLEFTREKSDGAADAGKDKAKWSGKSRKTGAGALATIKDFESDKVNDMLRAYKDLNAIEFGDDKPLGDVGLDKPAATVTFTLEDGAKRVLDIGATAEGSNRWARDASAPQVYTVTSYVADWGLAELKKFQSEKKKDSKPSDSPPPDMPGMPPDMPGMPPSMPDEE
ncbi:MAG: DUF4340 domain-containing protein [Verrucomicrobia bacterium]|nr:DUF4340 domain-containing protein [Verrucomicrobiota bacterium]